MRRRFVSVLLAVLITVDLLSVNVAAKGTSECLREVPLSTLSVAAAEEEQTDEETKEPLDDSETGGTEEEASETDTDDEGVETTVSVEDHGDESGEESDPANTEDSGTDPDEADNELSENENESLEDKPDSIDPDAEEEENDKGDESEDSSDHKADKKKAVKKTGAEKSGKEEAAGKDIDMKDWTISGADVSKTWGGDLMGLTEALEKAPPTDNTITVAVIDTGINTSHEWLSDRISGGKSCLGGSYADDNGHGSHVAGIIAANTPDNVDILAIKALNSDMSGTPDDLVDAIRYAADQGSDIINLSLGFSKNSIGDEEVYSDYVALISSALSYASDKGCLIVASAGNENSNIDEIGSYPANSPNVITVSAISDDKSSYFFSNYGGEVDFCAPGEDIYSAWKGGSSYQQLSGTSMAAPFISAALAWILLYNPGENAESILQDCCEDLGDHGRYGSGIPVFQDGVIPGAEQERDKRPVINKSSCDGKSITLQWENPEGCVFSVYRKTADDSDFSFVGQSDTGSFSDDADLVPRITYNYQIVAESEDYYEENASDVIEQEFYIPITKITRCVDGVMMEDENNDSNSVRAVMGETKKLSLIIEPENATYKQIEWRSVDESIVSVDDNGVVKLIKPGTTSVYARIKYCKFSIQVNFYVSSGNKCGDSLTWDLVEDGTTLYISGEGEMYNYDVAYNRNAPWYEYRDQITKIQIEEGVNSIGTYAFWRLSNVKAIEGMRNLKKIGNSAFSDCTGSILLPENVELDKKALDNAALDKLIIPSAIKMVYPRDTFSSTNIKEYVVSTDSQQFSSDNGVLFSKDKTELISYPDGREGAYVVPDSVIKIRNGSFRSRVIEEIIIPDSVIEIQASAFWCCKGLKKVKMSENTKIIGQQAFGVCEALSEFHIPDQVEKIQYQTFCKTALKEIEIPENVIYIDTEAFRDCHELVKASIKGDVTELGRGAFSSCDRLEQIELPGTLKALNKNSYVASFSGCSNLKTVTFGGFIKQFDAIENLDMNDYLKKLICL